ncbi:MAG: hypothetical protein NVS1B11_24220 [Terriglobales bacterium]
MGIVKTRYSKAAAFLLLGIIASVSSLALTGVSRPSSTPCHSHPPENTKHAPVDFACCIAGHSRAVVPDRFECMDSLVAISEVEVIVYFRSARESLIAFDNLATFFGDPPAQIPLRI